MSILQTSGTLYTNTSDNDLKLNQTLFGGQGDNSRLKSPNHKQAGKKVMIKLYTGGTYSGGAEQSFTFPVNPEEFQFVRTERMSVTQTLGDPFIDDLGMGLPTLQIRGTTGWRTQPGQDGTDGKGAFDKLSRDIFQAYHNLRTQASEQSKDPDKIRLVVLNEVDDLAYRVVPVSFELLRNKNQPLLYQYNIQLRVIEDLNNIGVNGFLEDHDALAILEAWSDNLVERLGKLGDAIEWVNDELVEPAKSLYKDNIQPMIETTQEFMTGVGKVLGMVDEGIGVVANVVNSVTTSCGNLFTRIMNTGEYLAEIPLDIFIALNHVKNTYHEIQCYADKGLAEQWFADYRALQGINDCALTLNITDGSKAMVAENVIQYASNLKALAKNKEGAHLVTWKEPYEQDFSTPMAIDNDFTDKVTTALLFEVENREDVNTAFSMIKEIVDCISFNSTIESEDIEKFDDLTKVTQVKEVTVAEGETLQSIAYRELGSIDRWKDIVSFNDIAVETPEDIFYPTTDFSYSTNIAPGNNYIDYGTPPPSDFSNVGSILRFIDSNFKIQDLTINEIVGTTIYFNETFSQAFTAPIKVICYRNKAGISGYVNSETTLSEPWTTGNVLKVNGAGNIYIGYVLYIQGVNGGNFYNVENVDYLQNEVTVDKISLGFESGETVEIFNTEVPIIHVQSGTVLKIPLTGTRVTDRVQTDEEIFGIDIKLTDEGLLDLESGDLNVVSGVDNLKQAIQHRLYCPYETIPLHPEYGCGITDILGDKLTKQSVTLTKAQIISALNAEPRMKAIDDFRMANVGDAIGFSIKVKSVNENTPTDLNFVLEG